jgi:hypothetical protein
MRKNNQPTYRPDLLKVILDATTPSNLASIDAQPPCKSTVVLDKDQVNAQRKANARWQAYTTGNAYVLYVQSRTMNHDFRVQAYGKNAFQAVRRYYRGLDNACNWIWQCTKVVAVYSCADTYTAQAGDLLHGQAQDRAPW